MPKTPAVSAQPSQDISQAQIAPSVDIGEEVSSHSTPPDMLHNYASHIIQANDLDKHREHIDKLAENPNTPSHTLTDLYSHLKSKNNESDQDLIHKLAIHANSSAPLIEQHIADTLARTKASNYDYSNRYDLRSAVLNASLKSGINQDTLRSVINDYIANDVGDKRGSYSPIAHIDPSHYLQMLNERPEMHPQAEHLTEQEEQHNNRIKRLDATALENLAISKKHTYETLHATAQYFSSRPKYGQEGKFEAAISQFVDSQKQLTPEHLDSLFDPDADSYVYHEMNSGILEHPNVNPTLLAAVANGVNGPYSRNSYKEPALSHPNLPNEVVRSIVDNPATDQDDIRYLSANPKLSTDDIRKLYSKADERNKSKIAKLDTAPEDLKVRHWNESSKSTEVARDMLEAKNLPSQVLKDIVNHKNQNVAVEALKHPSINEDVLNVAIKRKAAAVADAAARHPLVAGRYFDQRIKEGKLKGSELLFNKQNREAVDPEKMSEYTRLLHERYKDSSDENIAKLKENKEDFFKVKSALANAPDLSPQERDQHMSDIAKEYRKSVPTDQPIWSLRGNAHGQNLIKTAIEGAKRGNEAAEDAILATPQVLSLAGLKQGHQPEFLTKAYNSLSHIAQNRSDIIKSIAANPVTPEDTFNQIISQPEMFDRPDNYMLSSRDNESVFDNRWKELPDKDERFRQLATRPEARDAVVRSSTAPKDAWKEAFMGMNPENRERFLHDYPDHAAKTADDGSFVNMLQGNYNVKDQGSPYWRSYNDIQLSALDQANPEHIDHLINYLSNTASEQTPDHLKITPSEFSHNLSGEIYASHRINDLISHAMNTQPGIGVELQAKDLLKNTPDADEKKPEILNQYIDKLKTIGMEGRAPHEQKDIFANRISDMLDVLRFDKSTSYSSHRPGISKLIDEETKKTNALDFLADDVSNDPTISDHIRQIAISQNLLSDNKLAEVMNRSPDAFAESIKALDLKSKAIKIRETLSKGVTQPEVLAVIVDNMNNATLNPAYVARYHRRGDTQPQHIAEAVAHAANLGSSLARANMTSHIAQAASAIVHASIEPNRGGMKIEDRKKVVRSFIEAAQVAAPTEEMKDQIVGSIYRHASKFGDLDFMPASIANSAVKAAIRSNDIEALLELSKGKKSLPGVGSAIAKIFDKPETLSDSQLTQVVNSMHKINMNAKGIRKVTDAFLSRPSTVNTKGDLYQGILNVINGKSSPDIDAEAIRSASLNIDNPIAQRVLTQIVSSSSIDSAKSAFLSLPDVLDSPSSVHVMQENVVNDPEIVRRSLMGWRLGVLAKSHKNLTSENKSILIDRLAEYQGDDLGIERPSVYTDIISTAGTKGEDAVRLYRSMNPQEKTQFTSHLADIAGDEGNSKAVAAIIPHLSADFKEEVNSVAIISDEPPNDLYRTLGKFNTISNMASRLRAKDISDKDVKSEYEGLAADTLERSHEILSKVEQTSQTDPNFYKPIGSHTARQVANSLADIASISEHEALDSAKMLDQFHRAMNLWKSSYGAEAGTERNMANAIDSFAKHWIKNAKVEEEQWPEAFKKIPEMPFFVHNRDTIDVGLYKALNFEKMIQEAPDLAIKSFRHVAIYADASSSKEIVLGSLDKAYRPDLTKEKPSYLMQYAQMVHEAVKNHPTVFSAQKLRDILSREGMEDQVENTENTAYTNGAGGRDFFDEGLRKLHSHITKQSSISADYASKLAASPFLKEDDAKSFFDVVEGKYSSEDDRSELICQMLDNQVAPESIIRGLYESMSKSYAAGNITSSTRKNIVNKTIKHRNLPRDTFYKLHEDTKDLFPTKIEVGREFNPALVNPRFGGELFRSLPIDVPKDVPNVNKAKLETKAVHSEKQDKIRQVLPYIPAEGIAWPQFKKLAPKLENVPEIKNMFMAKQNKPLMPEDVVSEMRKHAPDEYHVTYTRWDGTQRHLPAREGGKPNLVVQLNTSASMESKLSQDPKLWNFFQYIQKSANHVTGDQIGGHPVTPHIASWVRVDTSGGNDGWVIEEFQSDFSAKLRKQLKVAFRDRTTIDLDGQKYTQEETTAMVRHIEKLFSSWVDASYQTVEESARKHGVKNLYVHGPGVRRSMSHISADKHVEIFDEAYERQPQKRGFEECQYTDYPKYSKATAEDVTSQALPDEKKNALKCWVKKLTS